MKILSELKKRKVLQTAALYFAIAWGAAEILSFLISRIPIFPVWTETAIAILFVLGFPVAVFLAWMFDLDMDGVRRADPTSGVGKGVIAISLAGLLVLTGALSYLLLPQIQKEHEFTAAGDLGTVAVLPFENLTGDPSFGYLGVGLAEDIRQRLSSFTNLKVIGRVSITGFVGSSTDLASVRGLLNAGLLLEGNLQKVAGQLRVTTSLVDTVSGRRVWSNTFNASETGWEPLRQRILKSLAEQMALTVRVKEENNVIPDEALEAYLRALSEFNAPAVADGYLDQAIRIAPEFADAWSRKALLRYEMIWRGLSREQAWEEAEPLFMRAREIDPDNLLSYVAEGHLQWLAQLDPISALATFERASAISPGDAQVLAGMGTGLRYVNRKDEAIDYHRRYLSLDPLNPDAHLRLGASVSFVGATEEAISHFDRALELDSGKVLAYDYKANIEFFNNQPADALVTLTQKARVENPARPETVQCMVDYAAQVLPLDRAEELLRKAVNREGYWSSSVPQCSRPEDRLSFMLAMSDRPEEALAFAERVGPGHMALIQLINAQQYGDGDEQMRLLAEMLGQEGLDAFLGSSPPIHDFNREIVIPIASALIDAGRVEEAQRLLTQAIPFISKLAGPNGRPGRTSVVVGLLALAGETEEALSYAERFGPDRYYMFGSFFVKYDDVYPELSNEPRWQAIVAEFETAWQSEMDEFDRRVDSGEIVMPLSRVEPFSNK